jgi:hypothetical protein
MVRGRVVRDLVDGVGRMGKRRSGGDVLAAGKGVVLARLIVKGLEKEAERTGEGREEVEGLGRRVNSARRKLLGWIERVVGKKGEERERVVRALTAYTLVVSATPKEVLRFFLQVRLSEVESRVDGIETGKEEEGLAGVLDAYAQTLVDVKDIFPRRFSDALAGLEKVTLVKDRDVRAMEGLSLDVYEKWIPEDVRNFHPYVRHEQLSTAEVGSGLAAWTKQSQVIILQGVKTALDAQTDVEVVLSIRQNVLSKYISLSTQLRSEQHSEAIESIRFAFLDRLSQLAERAADLDDFTTHLTTPSLTTPPSMWFLHATPDLDTPVGASRFRQAVLSYQHGHSPATLAVSRELDSWSANLQTYSSAISRMKAVKWADDLDLDLDDLTDAESLHHNLSHDDPEHLSNKLQAATAKSLSLAYERIEASYTSNPSETKNPALVLRAVREVDHRRRALGDLLTAKSSTSAPSPSASEAFISSLHSLLATTVISKPLQRYTEALASQTTSTSTAPALWDGNPPLPVQLSTHAFRFLRDLQREMTDMGTDLWSRQAVEAVKREIGKSVADAAEGAIKQKDGEVVSEQENANGEEGEGAKVNGEERKGEKQDNGDAPIKEPTSNGVEATSRPQTLQLLFDVLYLQYMLHTDAGNADTMQHPKTEQSNDGLSSLAGRLLGELNDLDTAAKGRLRRSARESWKRTYLLFGLLAG